MYVCVCDMSRLHDTIGLSAVERERERERDKTPSSDIWDDNGLCYFAARFVLLA